MKGWIPAAAGTALGVASYVDDADAQHPLYTGTVPSYEAVAEMRSYVDAGLDGEGFGRQSSNYILKLFPRTGNTTFWAYMGENLRDETPKPPFWGAGIALEKSFGSGENGLYMLPTLEGSGGKAEGGSLYTTLKFADGKCFIDLNPGIKFVSGDPSYSATFNVGRKIGKFDVALSSACGPEGMGPVYARLAFPVGGFRVDLGAGVNTRQPSDATFRLSIAGMIGESTDASARGKVKHFSPHKPHSGGSGHGYRRSGTPVDYHDRQHRRNASKCSYRWDANAHYGSRCR